MRKPGYTCPLTDKVVDLIDDISHELRNITTSEDSKGDLDWCIIQLSDLQGLCNDMRSVNAELREWGELQEEKLNILQDEYDKIINN